MHSRTSAQAWPALARRLMITALTTTALTTTVLTTTVLTPPLSATPRPSSADDEPATGTPAGLNQSKMTDMTTDFFIDPEFHGRWPRDPLWRPGHDQVLARWTEQANGEGGPAWWLFSPRGEHRLLARPADLGAGQATEVEELAWDPAGTRLLFVRQGDLYLFDVESGRLRQLTDDEAEDKIPAFSPDGKKVAFVRDDELHLLAVESGDVTRLTHDGRPGVVHNGITDWVYWEEIWGRRWTGHWWSPEGTHLAFYHVDDSAVGTYPLVDTSSLYPEVDRQHYPKAGQALPKVEIRVVELATGKTVRLATGDDSDAYLARVHWHPAGDRIAVERINRDQNRIDLLLCGIDGEPCVSPAAQEWPTWINLGDEFTFLSDGRFLWADESEGWRHLYLHDADGAKRRRLTPDGWCVTSLDAVNEDDGWLLFTAYSTGRLGAAERHVFRGFLDGSPAERRTEEAGWYSAQVSDSGLWVEERSTANSPPRLAIRDVDRPATRVALPATPPPYDAGAVPATEFLTLPGPDGSDLPAQLIRPAGFDAGKKYPVIMYHYGGPGSQVIYDHWYERGRYLWHKWMAMRGYAVFSVDNRASKFFGKNGEDLLYRRFGEVELAGQLAGVEYLKQQPWVDAGRIGLWGWSGGGTHTLYSLLHSPGVWKAGVSGAPVTDWRYYDAIWIERYLDHPEDNEQGYADSSPITAAANLRDALLLVHGTIDNNVHPQNTINMARALIAAEVPFELDLLPGIRHSLQAGSRATQRHFFARMTEFFDRHLGFAQE